MSPDPEPQNPQPRQSRQPSIVGPSDPTSSDRLDPATSRGPSRTDSQTRRPNQQNDLDFSLPVDDIQLPGIFFEAVRVWNIVADETPNDELVWPEFRPFGRRIREQFERIRSRYDPVFSTTREPRAARRPKSTRSRAPAPSCRLSRRFGAAPYSLSYLPDGGRCIYAHDMFRPEESGRSRIRSDFAPRCRKAIP